MNSLIQKTHEHVSQLLEEKLAPEIVYHNLLHTKRVFKSTKEILEHSSVNEKDAEALQLASLLHDVGYISQWDGHEEISAQMAQEFLKGEGADQELIDKVVKCILATKMEHEPQDELEYIIRDADASHFAKDYYLQASEYLREELKNLGIHDYSLRKWTLINIDLFSNKHQWYTDYAKEQWEPQKKLNLKMLKEESSAQKEKKKKAKLAKLKAKLKDESPEKAIQSMYRVTLRNHIKLSDIADTKANILLSVNAIIISLALSNLIPKLDNPSNAYLIVPTVVFVIFSVAAMILSVLATRPNVTRGKFTREDVEQKRVNLLFFGNFHKMEYQEFDWAINQMLNDKDYIYSAMTKDLYFLGIVLDRKYKILRLTYTVFIVGIIVSVIAFAIAFQWSAGIREAMGT